MTENRKYTTTQTQSHYFLYRRQVDLDLSDLTRQGHPGAVLGCARAQTPEML